jgi:hypothetical protein
MSTKQTLTLTPYQRTVIIGALAVAGLECPLLATLIETAGPVAITLYSKDLRRTEAYYSENDDCAPW